MPAPCLSQQQPHGWPCTQKTLSASLATVPARASSSGAEAVCPDLLHPQSKYHLHHLTYLHQPPSQRRSLHHPARLPPRPRRNHNLQSPPRRPSPFLWRQTRLRLPRRPCHREDPCRGSRPPLRIRHHRQRIILDAGFAGFAGRKLALYGPSGQGVYAERLGKDPRQ